MTDAPMTQDKHDTLIDRLNLDHEVLLGDLWDEASGNDALREAYKTIARNTQEAISRLKQSQWVRIEYIPEEWKDGRIILFLRIWHGQKILSSGRFDNADLCSRRTKQSYSRLPR